MDSMGLVNNSISFGELSLYEINDQYIYPFIYPADNIMYVKNNSEIISKLNQTNEKTIFIEKNNSKDEKISIYSTPKINFSKIHSSKYIVDIKDSHNGFILVFSEKYSKNWEIFIGEKNPSFFKLLFNKQKQNHLKVNSFANAWYINKKGDFFATIYYKNQLFYYIGIFISILTASFLFIILFKKK